MHINAQTNKHRIVIVGAGGHGKVVADALVTLGFLGSICFADDALAMHGRRLLDFPVAGSPTEVLLSDDFVHIAIGNNFAREKIFASLMLYPVLSVHHPTAIVSRWATYGAGSFVAANAIVGPDTALGIGVIVNHCAVIDHDCKVGDFSHVAPGASLAGGVSIGAGVLIGAGARLLPGIHVGARAVVGAGAVVTKNVAAGVTVTGVPAAHKA